MKVCIKILTDKASSLPVSAVEWQEDVCAFGAGADSHFLSPKLSVCGGVLLLLAG